MNNNDRNLVPFANDGIEIVIDTKTGESFASQSALARMCDVSETAIRKWISSNQINVITLEIDTGKGLRTSNIVDENAIFEALANYKPEMLVQLAKVGIRVYLHRLAGYKVTSEATTKPLSPAEIILQQAQMLVDIERKLSEQDNRLTAIEQTSKAAKEQLAALPPASVEAEPLTTRFALSRLVRSYAIAHNLEIGECWNRLYLEYRDRSHIDLKRRAKSHKPKISCAEYAERYGYIEPLYAVAHQLFA